MIDLYDIALTQPEGFTVTPMPNHGRPDELADLRRRVEFLEQKFTELLNHSLKQTEAVEFIVDVMKQAGAKVPKQ